MKSSFKTGGTLGLMNDSLDKMKNEFLDGYMVAMEQSEAKKRTQASGQQLSQMVLKGNSLGKQELVEENDFLKNIVEQMKLDMEHVVGRLKQQELASGNHAEDRDFLRAEAIIAKEQRIADLERLGGEQETQIKMLMDERDRLIQISNDLRADLNRNQRIINEMMNNENGSPNVKTPKNMFDMKAYASMKDDMADLKSVAASVNASQ